MRLTCAVCLLTALLWATWVEATPLSPSSGPAIPSSLRAPAYAFQNTGGSDKSPKAAFFLSLLVPGLGELYSGARWRAAGFFATDVTFPTVSPFRRK